jgi:hypothetical protein
MRFQVLTATNIKMTAVWDATPCSLVETDRYFRCDYHLHYQGDTHRPDDGTVWPSETSVNLRDSTRCNNPESYKLYTRRCEFEA